MKTLVIATRKSPLALWQANFAKEQLEKHHTDLKVDIKTFITSGDKNLVDPISKIGGKEVFTKELEHAMLRGEADIAVHSLKDLPTTLPDGLILACVMQRENPKDVFLSQNFESLDALPSKAVVGTSSLRRRMQILHKRNDLDVKNLRGNIHTRINKLKQGEYDAIILAYAGIKRMELENELKYCTPIDTSVIIPSASQAAIGIEAVNKPHIIELLSPLHHKQTAFLTSLERELMNTLDATCKTPLGIHASKTDEAIRLDLCLGLPNGEKLGKFGVNMPLQSNTKDIISNLFSQMKDYDYAQILEQAKKMVEEEFNK